jgi:Prophage protein (DUF1660)
MTKENLLCRLFGHRWKPCHVLGVVTFNGASVRAWVYEDDVCQRCYKTEYRLGDWAKARDQRHALLARRATT